MTLQRIDLRSATPGRERWGVPYVYRRPDRGSALTARLLGVPGILKVHASTTTAGVLVEFDVSAGLRVGDLLRFMVSELLGSPGAGVPSSALSVNAAPAPLAATDVAGAQPIEDPLRVLLARVGVSRRELAVAGVLPVFTAAASFGPTLAFSAMSNIAYDKGGTTLKALGLASAKAQVWVLGAAVMVAYGLEIYCEYRQKRRWKDLATKIERAVKLKTFDHLQHLDMAVIDHESSAQLVSVLVDDAASLREFFESGFTDIIRKATAGVIINGILFYVSPGLALTANVALPVIIGVTGWFKKRATPSYAAAARAESELSRRLADDLSGIATIKSFTREEEQVERLRQFEDSVYDVHDAAFKTRFAHSATMRVLFYLSWAFTVTEASSLLLVDRMPRDMYAVVLFAIPELVASMLGIDQTTNLYRKASVAATRILRVLDVEPKIVDGSRSLEPAEMRGEVRFDDVSFRYSNGREALRHVDITLASEKVTAFVGPTGSGKTTIAKLLMRFYDADEGSISLDSIDVRDLEIRGLRSAIGYVGQDAFLFPGTIYDNIAFGRVTASIDEVRAAAKAAEIADFIEGLPDGYQTEIGDRGQKLSGGQRQRLCIARAVLKDPRILVFDEATSAVDTETEAALQRSLYHLSSGRTMVIIAHRLSTIRNADVIYVLDEGAVRERGTHAELLEKRGIYASLWRVQTGEPEGAAPSTPS